MLDISNMTTGRADTLIVKNLLSLFEEKDLKPTPLALKAGLSRAAIADILSGKTGSPKHSTLEKIAEAAGVDVTRITVGPASLSLDPHERRMLAHIARLDEEKRLKLEGYAEALSED